MPEQAALWYVVLVRAAATRSRASVGVRTTGGDLDLTGLLEAADEAMYDVKREIRPDVTA